MNRLTILQYNCGNANHCTARPVFDSAPSTSFQVLAIQEPGYNKFTKSTYCSRGYSLFYEALPTTKVCFMVSNSLGIQHWTGKQFGPFTTTLRIQLEDRLIYLVNIYNPRSSSPRAQAWGAIEAALDEAEGEILLVGNFNAHHPTWGGPRAASETQAEHLLQETRR